MVTNRDDSNSGTSSGVQERILSVLLNEMDGIGSTDQAERIGVRLTKTLYFSCFQGRYNIIIIEHFFENVQIFFERFFLLLSIF